MADQDRQETTARPGDGVEVSGRPGRSARHGEIAEVLGDPGHERYRVHWDDGHESLLFPTEAVHVERQGRSAP